jgi:hypothetical protein
MNANLLHCCFPVYMFLCPPLTASSLSKCTPYGSPNIPTASWVATPETSACFCLKISECVVNRRPNFHLEIPLPRHLFLIGSVPRGSSSRCISVIHYKSLVTVQTTCHSVRNCACVPQSLLMDFRSFAE